MPKEKEQIMKKYSWGIILILFASFQVIGGLINLGVVGTDNNLFEKILPILFGGALMFLGIMLYRSPESKWYREELKQKRQKQNVVICPHCKKEIGGYVQVGSTAYQRVSSGCCPHCGSFLASRYRIGIK